MPAPLPIDEVLPRVVAAARESGAAVLVAPPGAGKTTRVPPALLAALPAGREVVVLEPRRIAARMAAARVAAELGEEVGGRVGYEVRFERRVSRATRLRFVTENIINRRLLSDPELEGVGAVVLDEFHERHLAADLALAQLERLRARRADLALVVMSATLEPGPVAEFLGGCPVIESRGRRFPVAVEHAPHPSDRPLERQVAAAARRVLADADGDILVFLPGAAEIRRAAGACAELAAAADLAVLPLHGSLPAAEQDRAVAPARRRKLILSTNVAETSVTIDGVAAVIDSGLARVARHSPWSGLPALRVEPISQASAEQRAGRAGRTREGRCLRLYTRHDFEGRRRRDPPEIRRADLAELVLALRAAGVADIAGFPWLEGPPPAAIEAAEALLSRLGALDAAGAITALGRRMVAMPAHPRQARIALEAERRGAAGDGALLAALIGEREIRAARRRGERAALSSPSDLLDDLEAFRAAAPDGRMTRSRARAAGLDVAAAMAVAQSAKKLAAHLEGKGEGDDAALGAAILTGYPDRVAQRRRARSEKLLLCGGGAARLSPLSAVTEAELLVALDVEERGRGAERRVAVRRASAVEPDWLLELFLDEVEDTDELEWNPERERVERVRRLRYDGLTLEEKRDPGAAGADPEKVAALLFAAAREVGLERFVDAAALATWRARVALAGAEPPGDDEVAETLRALCAGCSSFAELDGASLEGALRAQLGRRAAAVDRLAPTHVAIPGRRRVPVHYEPDRDPWIESRVQDFFGLSRTPAVGGGAVPLVLHLLAPNGRAMQVTRDLAGFWERHYPELRRRLARRYPKHAWPEDPMHGARG